MAMNLLEMILSAQNGGAAQQAGAAFGLNQNQSQGAIAALLPAISSALKQNTSSPQGLAGLLGALQNGNHSQYLDNPATLNNQASVSDGNAILGHLFGSKDVSRQVASNAAAKTGISSDILKKMLPLVATLAMGSLSKQTGGSSMKTALAGLAMKQMLGSGQQPSGLGGLMGALTGANARNQRQAQASHQQGMGLIGKMLDADGDGSTMDDILGMIMKSR